MLNDKIAVLEMQKILPFGDLSLFLSPFSSNMPLSWTAPSLLPPVSSIPDV